MSIFELKEETNLDIFFDNKKDVIELRYGPYVVFTISPMYAWYLEWSGGQFFDEEELDKLSKIVEEFCQSEGIY